MSAPERISTRGAAPVAQVQELGAIEARAVLLLRLWSGGSDARRSAWLELDAALGTPDGAHAVGILDEFIALCTEHGRRPLLHHSLTCRCVGGDECCLAHVIAAAAEGDREDALMMAMMLVRADLAPALVALATQLGLTLRRMARHDAATRPPDGPLH